MPGGVQDSTLGGGVDGQLGGLAGFAGLGADQFQLGSADMLFNTLGPSEQELLSSLNGDDAAWMTDVTTTTSDFPYWSSLSFAPGDVSRLLCCRGGVRRDWCGVQDGLLTAVLALVFAAVCAVHAAGARGTGGDGLL